MKPLIVSMPGGIFTVRVWPTLMTVVMVSVMLALGSWQVERLHWKEHLLLTIHDRMQQVPVDVRMLTLDATADYRPASVTGVFVPDKIFYLNATSLMGSGGYHVLQPLQLDDGRMLLVDRGWIPYDHKNNVDQAAGPVSLKGTVRYPQHNWVQPANNPITNDWYWIDLRSIARQAGINTLLPVVFDVDAASNASAYPEGGQTRLDLPNNHLQYALTWYGLALALTIIYSIQGYSRQRKV